MKEFVYQLKTNRFVRYAVILVFILFAYLVTGRSIFATLVVIAGMVIGRLSYNDQVDKIDV